MSHAVFPRSATRDGDALHPLVASANPPNPIVVMLENHLVPLRTKQLVQVVDRSVVAGSSPLESSSGTVPSTSAAIGPLLCAIAGALVGRSMCPEAISSHSKFLRLA